MVTTEAGVTALPRRPLVVFLMGVTGSGKTTLGEALGLAWSWPYHDADAYHPPANVAKMRAGTPLTDDDRVPWLIALHDCAQQTVERGDGAVIGCSALKASYRAILRGSLAPVAFVWLDVPREALQARMDARRGHFMPASLLDSQLHTLEAPVHAFHIDGDQPVEDLVREVTTRLIAWQESSPQTGDD